MAPADHLAYLSATDLAALIRCREVSPVEAVDAAIERIEERNPSLNAFVFRGCDDARARAREAERSVMAGDPLGPLHGVPVAMKDLFDLKPGWVSTFGGLRALKDFVADSYCVFAQRIERAGAIIVGKTNSPVMGFRGTCDNPLFGPTRNPFDLSRNSGGSSGGSAAAVADGMVALAEGTDGGGSIRIPAAWCGVYGYKASFGRIPVVMRPNAFGADTPFLFEGTLTRTVGDAALALSALSGYDARDPFSLDQDVDSLAACRAPVAGRRVAYSPDFGVYPVDPRIAAVVRAAAAAFEGLGAHVEEVPIGIRRHQRELSALWRRQIMLSNIGALDSFKRAGIDLVGDHRDDFPQEFLETLAEVEAMSVRDLMRDQEVRTEVYDAVQAVFETHDLLVTPTLAAMPVENQPGGATVGPSEVNGEAVDPLIGWCMTYVTNFSGHPSASIPAGMVDGLPVGMQIIGRRYADADVLAASAAFEIARPWHHCYEACRTRPLAPR